MPKHPRKIMSVNGNIKDYSQKLNDGDQVQIFSRLDEKGKPFLIIRIKSIRWGVCYSLYKF